jgi:DNA-binding transcriptional LysR family regulator
MRTNSLTAVDVNLFKVFAAIYSQRNLTRAGDGLAMTQPAVSRALDRLRAVFNDRLFYRVEGEMRPTRVAELLAPHVLDGLARLESSLLLKTDESPLNQAVDIRLGLNDYLSAVALPAVLAQLRTQWPRAFVSTIATTYETAPEQVLREELDCAIVSTLTVNDRIATRPLFEEDYVVVMAADHPLAAQPALDIDGYLGFMHLLVSYTGVRSGWVDQTLQALGHKREIGAVVHLYAGVPHLLRSHPYLCTVPRRLALMIAAGHGLSVHELPFESVCHLFHLVWARHLTAHALSACMREQIVAACQRLAEAAPSSAPPLPEPLRRPAPPG